MNISDWCELNRDKFDSDYEILFAKNVLPLVSPLRVDQLTAQHQFVDRDGKKRYCDFTIVESDTVRLAIEVDGYDKRGTGTGMTHDEFLDWQRRQASLASQGWHVLRFANRDVRDYPERCADHISELLQRLRQTEVGRVEIVSLQRNVPEAMAAPTMVAETRPYGKKSAAHYIYVPVILLLAVVAIGFWSKKATQAFESPAPIEAPGPRASAALRSSSYGTLACDNPIPWSEAKEHIGEDVTVIGPLLATKPRPDLKGRPMWLDVGEVFPSRHRLNIVVWGRNWSNFDAQQLSADHWRAASAGRNAVASVCIKGRIVEYNGVPQIALQDTRALKIFFQ